MVRYLWCGQLRYDDDVVREFGLTHMVVEAPVVEEDVVFLLGISTCNRGEVRNRLHLEILL